MSGLNRTVRRLAGQRLAALAAIAVLLATACAGDGRSRSRAVSPREPSQAEPLYRGDPVHGTAHPLGMKWDWARVGSFTPYLQKLSGGATFFELVWCNVERKQGRRDWSRVDEIVRSSNQLGYTLYLKIRVGGSCWTTEGRGGHARGQKTASVMPADLRAYENFVRALVERYAPQGVHTYAIENEMNSAGFWDGTPQEYEQLARLAARAIRSVDPNARIFDGGISSTGHGTGIVHRLLQKGQREEALAAYQRYYDRRFDVRRSDFPRATTVEEVASAMNTQQARRNLNFLASTARLLAEGVFTDRQVHFYERWDNVPALLSYLAESTPPLSSIEAWEVGMFQPDEPPDDQTQAAETAKVVALLLGGGVQRVIWLPISYDPQSRRGQELRFGLLDSAGAVRPAGAAFEAIARAAAGGAGWRTVTGSPVAGVGFGRGEASTLVIWSDEETTLSQPPLTEGRAQLAGGRDLSWDPSGLVVGRQPVIISLSTNLDAALRLLSDEKP